jgi:hypothetical protein
VPVVAEELDYLDEVVLGKQLKLLSQIQLQLLATGEDQAVVEAQEQALQLLDLARLVMAGLLAALVVVAADRAVTLVTEPMAHRVLLELYSGQVQRFQQPTCFK